MIEVMVNLAVTAIALTGTAAYLTSNHRGLARGRELEGKRNVADQAKHLIHLDPVILDVVKNASHRNTLARNCIQEPTGAVSGCSAGSSALSLYHPISAMQMSSGDGIYYSADGRVMGPAGNPSHPYKVITTLRAACAGGASDCGRAETVELFYEVTTDDSLTASGAISKTLKGSRVVDVAQFCEDYDCS